MSYWKDTYGIKNKDFIEGVIAGVTAYAFWRDGKQRVGVLERDLYNVIEEIKQDLTMPEEENETR